MDNSTATADQVTIGIDLGDKWSHFSAIDFSTGEVLEEGRVPTTPKGFRRKFESGDSARVVVEVGTHSRWSSQLLEELGHDVIVANPRMLRLIHGNDVKSDALDAERLARLGRVDPTLLRPIRHRSNAAQVHLSVIKARDALVRTRTLLINTVRGTVKSTGARIPSCAASTFHKVAAKAMPATLLTALGPILEQVENTTVAIRAYDKQIAQIADVEFPETKRLRQIKGVGPLTSLAFVLTLEDPNRFQKSRTVGRFLGLTPRQFDSGQSSPQLGITKAGNSYLRRLLVSAAHYVLGPFGPPTDLRAWGLKLATRGGGGGPKTRRASPPPLSDWRELRSAAQQRRGLMSHLCSAAFGRFIQQSFGLEDCDWRPAPFESAPPRWQRRGRTASTLT